MLCACGTHIRKAGDSCWHCQRKENGQKRVHCLSSGCTKQVYQKSFCSKCELKICMCFYSLTHKQALLHHPSGRMTIISSFRVESPGQITPQYQQRLLHYLNRSKFHRARLCSQTTQASRLQRMSSQMYHRAPPCWMSGCRI